ncbi:MAG: hypothetical protein K1X78_03550 [Verrucomicrobiaceae bacterium]|nr:hypothetical protein [Verrucomicrobiaceae bacterium]
MHAWAANVITTYLQDQSLKAMNSHAHSCLQTLLDLPGVENVLLIDHTGDCLAHLGHTKLSPAQLTVWSVLARASFGAGDELGRRADSGSCQEITNVHERGGSILRLVPGGQLLVVHFSTTPALGTLRLAVRQAVDQLATAFVPAAPEAGRHARSDAIDPQLPATVGAVLFENYETTDEDMEAISCAMCHED